MTTRDFRYWRYATPGDAEATLHDLQDGTADPEWLPDFRAALWPDSLDAAWAEAEAALPGWWSLVLSSDMLIDKDSGKHVRSYRASVVEYDEHVAHKADAETPAAALRALAEGLREARG